MFKLISSSITKSPEGRDTDVHFRYLTSHKSSGRKVRFHIVSNSYAAQCSAVAQVWSDATLSWNEVARLMPGEMETEKGLFYDRLGTEERNFEEDYETLMKLVDETLGR